MDLNSYQKSGNNQQINSKIREKINNRAPISPYVWFIINILRAFFIFLAIVSCISLLSLMMDGFLSAVHYGPYMKSEWIEIVWQSFPEFLILITLLIAAIYFLFRQTDWPLVHYGDGVIYGLLISMIGFGVFIVYSINHNQDYRVLMSNLEDRLINLPYRKPSQDISKEKLTLKNELVGWVKSWQAIEIKESDYETEKNIFEKLLKHFQKKELYKITLSLSGEEVFLYSSNLPENIKIGSKVWVKYNNLSLDENNKPGKHKVMLNAAALKNNLFTLEEIRVIPTFWNFSMKNRQLYNFLSA